jgi:hypothetical protein
MAIFVRLYRILRGWQLAQNAGKTGRKLVACGERGAHRWLWGRGPNSVIVLRLI